MPTPSLSRKHSRAAVSNRWNMEKSDDKQASSNQDEEFAVSIDEAVTVDDDAANPRISGTLHSKKNLLKTLSLVFENHSIAQSRVKVRRCAETLLQ